MAESEPSRRQLEEEIDALREALEGLRDEIDEILEPADLDGE